MGLRAQLVSGTAAAVLAGFCSDSIAFAHATDTAPDGQQRFYPSFSAAAAEAARSRIFGGQHFEFSNQTGQALGRGFAAEVLRTALLVQAGRPTAATAHCRQTLSAWRGREN